jgi:hypothetical protein
VSPEFERLAEELGVAPPQEFAALSSAELTRLADLLGEAREQQATALSESLEAGLGFIPRVARGAVKRVLFG